MSVIAAIADRRIAEGREAGLFDDLPGTGQPIADLHRERPAGWWAIAFVRRERDRDDRAASERP